MPNLIKAIVGRKADDAKPRWSLIPFDALSKVLAVLEFGARKYDIDNWKKVPNAEQRYKEALMRHVVAYFNGELIDTESGESHLAHAACNTLFLIWFSIQKKEVIE